MDLSKYKNALGEPNKGIHSYRFMGVAIADVIMTVILAYFIHYFSGFNFWYILAIVFLSGIFLHRIFSVRTTIDKLLFYWLKK
jgi:hypothetical protein